MTADPFGENRPPSSDGASDSSADFARKCRDTRPSCHDAMQWDPTIHVPFSWREAQLRDQRRWTRRFLFPVIVPVCIVLMILTRIVKRILPFPVRSWGALNFLSEWFVKRFVSPEAQQVVFRHFALEANVINFIARNTAKDVPEVGLYPRSYRELGDWEGLNATFLHDCNILNLFIDLGKSETADVFSRRDVQALDFSMLRIPDYPLEADSPQRIVDLDLETSLYIMVLFLVFLFDEDVALNAANSLSLDEGVVNVLANITGDNYLRRWSPYRYPNRLFFPLDPAKALHEHIITFEYLYTRLCLLRDGAQNPLYANV